VIDFTSDDDDDYLIVDWIPHHAASLTFYSVFAYRVQVCEQLERHTLETKLTTIVRSIVQAASTALPEA
jgi:hypothetical protein